MSSNISAVVARLVALSSDITGITTASDGWPDDALVSTDLPLMVVEDGDAEYQIVRLAQQWLETREYALTLLVQAAITGRTDLDIAGRKATRVWLHTIVSAFMQTPRLERGTDSGLAGVTQAVIAADTRPGVVEHGSTAYWGAQFTARISVMHNSGG